MGARSRGGYSSLNQSSPPDRRWWERVPHPLATAAVKAWSSLPEVVRARFVPVGRWINPGQSTAPALPGPGPDEVPGVRELRAEGFTPIEEHTGAVWVAQVWPEQHRRSVPETRPSWRDDPHSNGRLWMVRSPWPELGLDDSLNVLWTWAERDQAALDENLWRHRVSEALAWEQATAVEWHRRTVR